MGVALLGCTGVAVDPRAMRDDLPAAVALEPSARAQAQQLGALGLLAAGAGHHEEARARATAALALDPRQAHARAAMGLLSMHAAQAENPPALALWRRAEGELLQAQALAPDDVDVALALARFYVADGHGRAARTVLEPLVASDRTHPAALRLAAAIAYESGEELRARPLLARLVVAEPTDVQALYRLLRCEAVVADRLEDSAAQTAAWRHVLELTQRYTQLAAADLEGLLSAAQAHFRLAQLAPAGTATADLRAAADWYRAARRLHPERAEPAYGEAVISEQLGEPAAAEAAYRDAIARAPAHSPSLLNLAALLAERGAQEEARALWERALATGLTPSERRRVVALLAQQ
jgi:tetratricopeptide (TPR) repeat protein